MKPLLLLALLTLAALSPAPILDPRGPSKPVPERSEAEVLSEMRLNGAYKPVGRIPDRTERTPLRDAPARSDAGSVATASAAISPGDDTIGRATASVQEQRQKSGAPVWLLLALAAGGAFGIVRGLRVWADKALPAPRH